MSAARRAGTLAPIEGGRDPLADERELFAALYQELRTLAERYYAREYRDKTLQATALVHEAWLRVADVTGSRIESRTHLFRLAARAMRAVLVDRARSRNRIKRGEGKVAVDIDGASFIAAAPSQDLIDVLDLDAALDELAANDEELARLVELRFFAGLTIEEIAEMLEVTTRTIERRWRTARAWLVRRLKDHHDEQGDAQ